MKKPLIVLTGPTAAGKTHLSIALAKAVNGEIISADSMQVYKYMDIGSAKIRPEEMQGVKHYLVDELLPQEEFHIVKFQQMAKAAMEEIYATFFPTGTPAKRIIGVSDITKGALIQVDAIVGNAEGTPPII